MKKVEQVEQTAKMTNKKVIFIISAILALRSGLIILRNLEDKKHQGAFAGVKIRQFFVLFQAAAAAFLV
jgi:hypothetical protein